MKNDKKIPANKLETGAIVELFNAYQHMMKVANNLNVPAFTTSESKGLMSEDACEDYLSLCREIMRRDDAKLADIQFAIIEVLTESAFKKD